MKPTTTLLGTLKRARKLIADGRWVKGSYVDERKNIGDCYCATGAVQFAATGRPFGENGLSNQVCGELVMGLRMPIGHSPSPKGVLIEYNDMRSRTRSQVVALFDRTIARLKEAKAKR